MKKGRCVPDDYKINEIDRGNGVKEIVYIREVKKPMELQSMNIVPRRKKIVEFKQPRKRKTKWQEMLIIGVPSALLINGIFWIKELLQWHNGILYKPYWIVTIGLIAFITYANKENRPSRKLRRFGN